MAELQSYLGLVQNVSLLLAAALVYDISSAYWRLRRPLGVQLLAGAAMAAIGAAVMFTPWTFSPGIVFDTRSVLIGICGLFFGTVPTAMVVGVTALLRLWQGGLGAATGVSVIVASGIVGLLWRHLKREPLADVGWAELFSFGFAVHLVMLALMLTLPEGMGPRVLRVISLPVLLIYPAGTALLGALMVNRLGRLRTEEALRRSEERFQLAMEASKDGIWDVDFKTGAVYFSPGYAAMLGLRQDQTRPSVDFWVERLHPDDREQALRELNDCLEGRAEGMRSLFRMRTEAGDDADPSWRWIVSRGRVVERAPDGSVARMVGTHTDITSQKRAEEELDRSRRRAEAANRSKSEFLANMSHELRTPLNGILGMLHLLGESPLDREQAEYAQMAKRSAERLTRLVSDILDISRVEAGKLAIRSEPFDFRDALAQVLDLFRPSEVETGVRMEHWLHPALPDRVVGDSVRLQQVLTNLVGNAFKFTASGSVSLEAYPLPAAEGSCRVLFTVADTGSGIPGDKLDSLFEPFTQAESGMRRDMQGAGLGLSISSRLAGLMDGEIAVESEPGRGSTFQFCATFKLCVSDVSSADEPSRSAAAEADAGRALRVLLAEDDRVNAVAASRMLEREGHSVRVARDGQEALEALLEERFDLVLMDMQMPRVDGLEAIRRLRSDPRWADAAEVTVVALTAYAMPSDRERFLAAGADGYVPKPVTREQLLRVVEYVRIGGRASGPWGTASGSDVVGQ